MDIKRVVANRHWCNKLWNAIRFALLNLGSDFKPSKEFAAKDISQLPKACRWVLSRLSAAVSNTISGFTDYTFGAIVQVSKMTAYAVNLFSLGRALQSSLLKPRSRGS